MTLADIALPVRKHVLAFAEGVREGQRAGYAKAPRSGVIVDDYGASHVFGETGNVESSAYGYHLADAKALRRLLKRHGMKASLDVAEALLGEALVWTDERRGPYAEGEQSATALRLGAWRAKQRRAGSCSRCGRAPAESGKTKCEPCLQQAREAVKRGRRAHRGESIADDPMTADLDALRRQFIAELL